MINTLPTESVRYHPDTAEWGKFIKLDSDTITNYPSGSPDKFAVLNYIVNTPGLPTINYDAFGRLRVSEAVTIFDCKHISDKQPLLWDESLTGTASSVYISADACVTLTVSASGDMAIRQTRNWFNYEPGKSQMAQFTFVAPPVSGVIQEVGLLNGNNGIYLKVSNNEISWNIDKNGITESVIMSAWNYDKMNGTGPSGLTLDITKAQIAHIDYEWLGVGSVAVGFVINRALHLVHIFHHSNQVDSVYMRLPNLPIKYKIYSTGGVGKLDHICSMVATEGGTNSRGITFSIDSDVANPIASNTGAQKAILGVRLKPNYLHSTVIPDQFTILSTSNTASFKYAIIINPSITTSPSLSWVDIENSPIQYCRPSTTATNNIATSGTTIESGIVSSETKSTNTQINNTLRIGSKIDGTSDELWITTQPTSNTTFIATLNIKCIF